MQILLANAKIMFLPAKVKQKPLTEPLFQSTANSLALEMAKFDITQLAQEWDCSPKIAAENWQRYQNFFEAEKMPAIFAYNGQAYKHLRADSLSPKALEFAQEHLWITCFLYGLLRPMDGIVNYRMEQHRLVNWRELLTEKLIDSVKADDGVLVHLSTKEYEDLFDWKRVKDEVRVVQPQFYVRQANGDLKIQAVWAKSCRGAMVRWILEKGVKNVEDLKGFGYEGFEFVWEDGGTLAFVKG